MNNMIKFSIITINYNNSSGLLRTIESVVNQDCSCFEYIIIDGGSTDGSVDVIKQYADKIDYWISESDNGIYNAMNKGIDKCNGKWCLFLNSGDFFSNNNILSVINEYDISENVGVVYGDWYDYSNEGLLYRTPNPFFEMDTFLHHKGICHQSSFTRMDLAKELHFDESFKIAADYKLFYDIYSKGYKFKYLPIPISCFEIGVGVSQRNPRIAFKEDAIILKRYGTIRYWYYYFKKFIYPKFKL